MYARVTTFQTNTDKYAQANALAEELKPEIMALPGIKFWFDAGNNEGEGCVIAVYESKESAATAMNAAREIFAKFGAFMASPPQVKEYDVMVHGTNS